MGEKTSLYTTQCSLKHWSHFLSCSLQCNGYYMYYKNITKPCIIWSNKTLHTVTKIISRPHLTVFTLEGIFAHVKFTEIVLLARAPTSNQARPDATLQISTEKILSWKRSMKGFPLHLLLNWQALALVGPSRLRPARNYFIYSVPLNMPPFEGSMYYFRFIYIEYLYM